MCTLEMMLAWCWYGVWLRGLGGLGWVLGRLNPTGRPPVGGARRGGGPFAEQMDGSFERSLYIVHERMLLVFTDVEEPTSARVCDVRRCCRNLEVALLALLLFFFSTLVAAHSVHVGAPGCFGAAADAAARAWSGAPNSSAAAFFLPSDVFHIELLPEGS